MLLTNPTRTAALVAVAAAVLAVAPSAAAEDAAADVATSARPEVPLDAGRVDVATISLADATMRLSADDGSGQPKDPDSLVYTADLRRDGVAVGWDAGGIEAGEVFGDTVTMRLRAAAGPAVFHVDPQRLAVGDRGTTTWTFPAPGRYTLTFTVEANLLTGEPVSTEENYTLAVSAAGAPTTSPTEPPPVSTSPPSVAKSAEALPRTQPATPLVAAAQSVPTTPGRIVLTEGHVDAVAPRLVDGKLQLQVKDGVTVGQAGGRVHWREPGNVAFHVKPEAKAALPADAALAFLGEPGDEIFLLPQQQQSGILWTGWSTEELRADQVSGPVAWRLTEVDGPGALGIFTTGSFGDSTVIFNSADGLPDTHSVALGTHAHANWGFAKQGVYRLTFDVTAKLAGGQTVSDREVYTFAVGDIDPNGVPPGGGGSGGTAPGDDDRTGSPGLASTGVSAALPLTAGITLVGLGGAAVLASRKRRRLESR